jgi:hypothetical protein
MAVELIRQFEQNLNTCVSLTTYRSLPQALNQIKQRKPMFLINITHVLHALFYSTLNNLLMACKNCLMSSKNLLGRSRLAKWPP